MNNDKVIIDLLRDIKNELREINARICLQRELYHQERIEIANKFGYGEFRKELEKKHNEKDMK